jgi:hypothetical protein
MKVTGRLQKEYSPQITTLYYENLKGDLRNYTVVTS